VSEQEKEAAAELAKRARTQSRNAAKNAGRAVKTVAEPAIESAAEEIHETVEKIEGTVEGAMHTVGMMRPKVLSHVSGDVALLVLELAVVAYAGSHAYMRFRTIRGFAKGYAEGRKAVATRPID
jgi:hypothetical protein